MRKFKILKWPNDVDGVPRPDLSKEYVLEKEFEQSKCVCLKVNGTTVYFYPNEVKEVTNE